MLAAIRFIRFDGSIRSPYTSGKRRRSHLRPVIGVRFDRSGCRSVAGSPVAPLDELSRYHRPAMRAKGTRCRGPRVAPPMREGIGSPPTSRGVRRISSRGGGTRRDMPVVHPDGQLEPYGEPVPLPRHNRFGVAVALDSGTRLELLETIMWIRRKLGASFATAVPKAPAIA